MKVSVVILNWNGRAMLEKFLPSVCANSEMDGVEVVVADNASTDDSIAFLASNYSNVRIVQLDQNYGFAEGYNRALASLEAQYFVLLNSDVEVAPQWLTPLLKYMDENPDVAACQPKILSYADKTRFEHAGASGGYIDKFGYPFCRGRIFDTIEKDDGQYESICNVFWATGAALLIRSDLYKNSGGLDSGFFAHMEEIDLCWRLNARGYRIVCIPQSVVYHVGGGTLNAGNPRKTFLNFRNNLLMIYKNSPKKYLRKILVARFVFDHLSAMMFLLKGDFQNCKAVFKARREYSKMKKDYISKRQENLNLAKVDDIKSVYDNSIVLSYFLKGKKNFIDLKINQNQM